MHHRHMIVHVISKLCLFIEVKRRRGIVVMDFEYYTGDRGSIPTSRRFTWQVKEPSPGSTHDLTTHGSQFKVLTRH